MATSGRLLGKGGQGVSEMNFCLLFFKRYLKTASGRSRFFAKPRRDGIWWSRYRIKKSTDVLDLFLPLLFCQTRQVLLQVTHCRRRLPKRLI